MNFLRSYSYYYLFLLFGIACTLSPESRQEEKWTSLLDQELSKWDTYLSFKHQNDYNGNYPMDDKGDSIMPIGMNPPNDRVFTTIMEQQETVIKVSGEYYGCLVSKEAYSNYHLQVKFKWGDKKWIPRLTKMKDTGILYHSIGELGAEYWRSWMMSQEFQIMEAHTGDYWSQANSAIDIRAYASESGLNPMADKSQPFLSFGKGGTAGNYCLRSNNYEQNVGEWNTLDLICFEDKSLHIVNGKVVMILQNSRYIDKNGTSIPLKKGKIQLQSEAAEVYFKAIKIKSITALPSKYKSLF